MSNHRRTSVHFDSKNRSWRGPVFQTNNEENVFLTVDGSSNATFSRKTNEPYKDRSRGRLSGQACNSENKDIDTCRARIRNMVKSACSANPLPSSPRKRSVPAVTWSQPPIEDHRQRCSAFDFRRPSRIYPNDSEEMCVLRRRSHVLFDELERERQGHSQLRREVVRLRDKEGRIRSLVKEIDDLKRKNETIAREIQQRRQLAQVDEPTEGRSESGPSFNRCLKCFRYGHWARDCRSGRTSSAGHHGYSGASPYPRPTGSPALGTAPK